jgi:signal peptidase II
MIPWLIGVAVVAVDQWSKWLVTHRFALGESHPVIPSVLYLTYVHNRGAAFSLFQGQQLLFVLLAAAVIIWIVWELARGRGATPMRWAWGLILGGAAGNLIDRLRFGHVIDFIDLRVWPVFNLADSAITLGVAWVILQSFRRK